MKDLSITIVYDNYQFKYGLATGWGFSCLIKGTEKIILFDTGGDEPKLISNMEKLGINPKEVDIVMLSHNHGDHTGGFADFFEKNNKVDLCVPQSFADSFKNEIGKYNTKIMDISESFRICKNVYSTGELGTWIKEQSLIIHTDRGGIVITGCAHPGIVKILAKAKDIIKDGILFATGGFHLDGESDDNIKNIISDFRKLGVEYVGPCHCSGERARQLFKSEYNDNFINVGTGRVITMENFK